MDGMEVEWEVSGMGGTRSLSRGAAWARQLLFFGEAARGRKDNGRCAKIGHLSSSSTTSYELSTTIHLSS